MRKLKLNFLFIFFVDTIELLNSISCRYILDGKKIINPYLFALYAWRETTTLHVKFKKVAVNNSKEDKVHLKGELHISLVELIKSLISLGGNNKGRFICLLLSSLFRTCFLQIPKGSHKDFTPSDLYLKFYPSSTLHEIKTGIRNLNPLFKSMKTQFCLELMLAYNAVSRESVIIKTRNKGLHRTMGYSYQLYQCVN
jgi:hypothetical protein